MRSTFCLLYLKTLLLIAILFGACGAAQLYAQNNSLPYQEVDLTDLDDFESTTPNWSIAGDVFMDLNEPLDVQPEEGAGVLVNADEGDDPRDIFTDWEHGDIDLELDFMMAKESNSGIYLQGRYEIQLLDSWGVKDPKFGDLGGIYEWWEDGKGTGGIPPRVNAARAPGLWQHMEIKFRAPRFDENGEKVANAMIKEIILNGEVIHDNLELVYPTGGAVSNEEVERGPLRFQGDHGPVAFKNIRYKTYDHDPLELSNLDYRYYEGEFETFADIELSEPEAEGTAQNLNLESVRADDEFAIVFEGSIEIEEEGDYLFELGTRGGGRLTIGGEVVTEHEDGSGWGSTETGTVSLSEGSHPVELVYFREEGGGGPILSLMAEGPGIERHALHDESSAPTNTPGAPLMVESGDEPMVLRGFMEVEDRVHSHSAAIGFPDGLNAGFDFNSGALMNLWKGSFINANTIWVNRGGGNLNMNEDAAITISGSPSLAYFGDRSTVWPDSLQEGTEFLFKSYTFEDNGSLTFSYRMDDVHVEDHLVSENEGRQLSRNMTFRPETPPENLFLRLARGEDISRLPNGLYQIDEKTFYVELSGKDSEEVQIRDSGDFQELLLPVSEQEESSVSYSYIW